VDFIYKKKHCTVYSSYKRSTVVACTVVAFQFVGMFSFMTAADCVHDVQVGTVRSDGVPFIKGTIA